MNDISSQIELAVLRRWIDRSEGNHEKMPPNKMKAFVVIGVEM